MRKLPSETAVRHLAESLRNLAKAERKGEPKLVDKLEAKLLAAFDRDRTGSPVPDGYPSSSGAPIGSGNGSSTESAALALVDGGQRDWHHDLCVRASEAFEQAVVNLNTVRAALASLDDICRLPTASAAKTCEHCTPHLPNGNARPVHRRGTVGDRLAKAMDLCEPCYFYVQRSAPPNSREGELPSDAQIRHHDMTGTWRLRVA